MFFTALRKILKSQIRKIRPVETEFFHADGQSDMTKLIVTNRNFANAPKTPAVYLKKAKSADCIWIYTVQHEVSVLKLTAFS